MAARPIWKGSLSFGLVTIPVSLYSATRRDALRFRQLDRRDLSPVREKRVSEKSGQEVPWEDVVKGYEYQEGDFVVLTQEDFRQANVEATETIDIVQSVKRDDIPPQYFDEPYHLIPAKAGRRAYTILRETLRRTDRVAVATVVMRSRQHLCAVLPVGDELMLDLLRFAFELRSVEDLGLKDPIAVDDVKPQEVDLGVQLVEALDAPWQPEQFHDEYRDDLLKLIERKATSGELAPVEEAPRSREPVAEVVDIMELLKRSVGEAGGEETGRRKGGRRKKAVGE